MSKHVAFSIGLIFAVISGFAPVCAHSNGEKENPKVTAGESAYARGDLHEAEKLFSQGLKEEEQVDKNSLAVAQALTDLGVVYDESQRFAEAETVYKRALAIREKALGQNDMAVATTLNNLANLYKDEKRYSEAEPLYKRSIDISLAKEGAKSPLLAPSYFNLASFYLLQDRPNDAIPLLKRCIEICDSSKEPDDHLMDVVGKLASVYDKLGKHAEAKPLYIRYFDMSAQVLGLKPDDPKTVTVLKAFAEDQRKSGSTQVAEYAEKAVQYKTKPAQ